MRLKLTEKERERLLSKIKVNPDTGCWEWQAYKERDGYGRLRFRGTRVSTHRLTYQWLVGEIPDGLELDHWIMNEDYDSCSRKCVNPDHLEPVTSQENLQRSPRWKESVRRNGLRTGNQNFDPHRRANGLRNRKHNLPEGVSPSEKRFQVQIWDPQLKKAVFLGRFNESELAARAYREARVRIDMGLFARNK